MLKLQDFRQTKIIELPSYPGSKIEIYSSILAGEAVQIDTKQSNELKLAIDMLAKLIKSWNFTDDQDKPLPINTENLSLLSANDVQFLTEQITNFVNESKKNEIYNLVVCRAWYYPKTVID